MTKEELINLIDDEGARESIYDFMESIAVCMFGSETKTEKVYDSRTKKYKSIDREMSLMEVLVSIKDALWTIADNM